MPVVNDGWYVMHCENEDCHNYYGMELRENEFSIADFVEWNEEILDLCDNICLYGLLQLNCMYKTGGVLNYGQRG